MTTIATRSISSRHEIPPKSINDRDRAANDVARPYWNFFLLICVALHVNNNIIINYKLILPCRYWECPPLHGISPADAASKTRGGGGRVRFIVTAQSVQCEFVPEGVCSPALPPAVALNFLYSLRRPASTPLMDGKQTLVSTCDSWMVVGIFNNFPVSTILKIGVGLKLLVCQTT